MPKSKSRPPRKSKAKTAAPLVLHSVVFDSALGWMALEWQGREVSLISMGHETPAAAANESEVEPVEPAEVPAWVAKLIAKLKRFAAGRAVEWGDVPLAFGQQSDFQKQVQRACQRIPRGEVQSYGEVAAAAGFPGAARAVGAVLRSCRFPLVVPCHRVIAAGGKVGGFSCVELKEKLLALEGVKLK